MNTALKKTLLASSIALTLGAPGAEAALVTNVLGANTFSTDSANFTMLAANGGVVGGTNDVKMLWEGSAFNSSSDYTGPDAYSFYWDPISKVWVPYKTHTASPSNVTLSSTAAFFGHSWTAHEIQMFLPGTYSFDVTLGGGNPETGMLNMTVGAGQLGMHMLWDWGGDNNIDVAMVFDINHIFGSGLLYSTNGYRYGPYGNYWQSTCNSSYTGTIIKNCLYDGALYGSAGAPVKNQV